MAQYRSMQDPDLAEMESALAGFYPEEFDDFDRAEAIYWFANDWHGGQTTNLYSVLSTSDFRPGPLANGPAEFASMLYDVLESTFGTPDPDEQA